MKKTELGTNIIHFFFTLSCFSVFHEFLKKHQVRTEPRNPHAPARAGSRGWGWGWEFGEAGVCRVGGGA